MNYFEEMKNAISKDEANRRKGGTRKIADLLKQNICNDREHNPPTHMVYKDGVYEHVCPSCGRVQIFTVCNPTL